MMLPLRYPTHWRAAGVILLGFVFVAAMVPSGLLWPGGLQISTWTQGDDKLIHGLTFAVLTLWVGGQYSRRSYWLLVLGLAVFGVLIEVAQGVIGYRTRDAIDLVANGAGILAGMVILLLWLEGWSLKVESWYDRRIRGQST